jgi:hypothetical protein
LKRIRRFSLIAALMVCAVAAALILRYSPPEKAPDRGVAATATRLGPAEIYPDPDRTPGAINSDITQSNIRETICNPQWSTKFIRPRESYTSRLKSIEMRERGLSGRTSDYEEDHLISLELGGDPTDPKNLWAERYKPTPGARQKDVVENYLHREVCEGAMTLDEAQRAIAGDWYRVYLAVR